MKGENAHMPSAYRSTDTHTCMGSYKQTSSDGLRDKSIKRVQEVLDLQDLSDLLY